jgi:hypothetical protein
VGKDMYVLNLEEEKLRNMTERFINYLEGLRKDDFITMEQYNVLTENKIQFIEELKEKC